MIHRAASSGPEAAAPERTGGRARRPPLLILRALGLGDLLTIVPALRGLASAFPDHDRMLAAPAPLAPLAFLTGAVDAVVPVAGLDVRERLPRCDVAVNVHGRGPESHRLLLRASPRRLIAFANPIVPESAGGPAWREDEHEVARWCRLLTQSGIPADPTELDLWPDAHRDGRPRISGPPHAEDERAVLLHPGAKDAARRWPEDRWAELARRLRRRVPVLVTAGPREVAVGRSVVSAAGLEPSALLSDMDIVDLAAAVASARVVVCGDTGVGHLATALRTPSVLLFGPTRPDRWGPPTERPAHRVLWAGRTGDPHGDAPFEGLLEISIDEVESAVAAAVEARPPRSRSSRDQARRDPASTGRPAARSRGASS